MCILPKSSTPSRPLEPSSSQLKTQIRSVASDVHASRRYRSSCSRQLSGTVRRISLIVSVGRWSPVRIASVIRGDRIANCKTFRTYRRVRPALSASCPTVFTSPATIRSYQSRARAIAFAIDATGVRSNPGYVLKACKLLILRYA
jgi:hypothetical protein